METRKLSFEEMEMVEGGSCGLAIGVAVLSGAAIIGATIIAPAIWLSPKTWYAAATLIAGNALHVDSEC